MASALRMGPAGLPLPSTRRARPSRWDRKVAAAPNGAKAGVAIRSQALRAWPAQAAGDASAKHPVSEKGSSTRRSTRGCSSTAAAIAIATATAFQAPAKAPFNSAQPLSNHANPATPDVAADLAKAQRRRTAPATQSRSVVSGNRGMAGRDDSVGTAIPRMRGASSASGDGKDSAR